MDKKSKTLLLIVELIVAGSIVFTFYNTVLWHNYLITDQVPCDPQSEKCSEELDDNGETEYYKVVELVANNAPYCRYSVNPCETE
jgi:hypothetical protein